MIDAAEVQRSRARERLFPALGPPTAWAGERTVVRLPFDDPDDGWTRSIAGSTTVLRGSRERRHTVVLLTVRAALAQGRSVVVLTGGHGARGWERDLQRIGPVALEPGPGWELQVLDASVTPDELGAALARGADLVVVDGADRLASDAADVFAGAAFRPVDAFDAVGTWARRTASSVIATADPGHAVPGPDRMFQGDHLVDLTDDLVQVELLVAPDGHPVRRFSYRNPGHWLRVDAPAPTLDPRGAP